MPVSIDELADQVRAALDSADLDAYESLLAADVAWGPPGDAKSGCHSRSEVLAWYRAGRAGGVRAKVTEVVAGSGSLLVGLIVSGSAVSEDPPATTTRWQVLKVEDGLITDIRGYEERSDAAMHAGIVD